MKYPRPRSFGIQTAVTLTLFAALAGCGEEDGPDGSGEGGGGGDGTDGSGDASIVGTWSLDLLIVGSYTLDLPYIYSEEGHDAGYGLRMRLNSETSGDWCYYEIYYGAGGRYDVEYCYEGVISASKVATATYDIAFSWMGVQVTCDLDGSSLSCDNGKTNDQHAEMEFFRVD